MRRMNSYRRVPLAVHAELVAGAVSGEVDRLAADVLNALAFFVEETVQTACRDGR